LKFGQIPLASPQLPVFELKGHAAQLPEYSFHSRLSLVLTEWSEKINYFIIFVR
jgi:hypothetical protein